MREIFILTNGASLLSLNSPLTSITQRYQVVNRKKIISNTSALVGYGSTKRNKIILQFKHFHNLKVRGVAT